MLQYHELSLLSKIVLPPGAKVKSTRLPDSTTLSEESRYDRQRAILV